MGEALNNLIHSLSKLPGLGPRSGRRAALHLLKQREQLLLPLIQHLISVKDSIQFCYLCGHLDEQNPCKICTDPYRDTRLLCIVSDVGDIWALERAGGYKGRYQVLGGTLSALEGRGPEDLPMENLLRRSSAGVEEVILALNCTVEGQVTAHYISDCLKSSYPHLKISALAQGIPLGGELDYLDEGTLTLALSSRRVI